MLRIFALCTSLCSGVAYAGVGATVASEYYWRGYLVPGVSLQPSADIALSDTVSVSAWGAFAMNRDRRRFDEIDLTAEYATQVDALDVQLGAIHYLFPVARQSATEVYSVFSMAGLPVTPSVGGYLGIGDALWYLEAVVAYTHGPLSARVSAAAGEDVFSDATASVSYTIDAGLAEVVSSASYGLTADEAKVFANRGREHTAWVSVGVR